MDPSLVVPPAVPHKHRYTWGAFQKGQYGGHFNSQHTGIEKARILWQPRGMSLEFSGVPILSFSSYAEDMCEVPDWMWCAINHALAHALTAYAKGVEKDFQKAKSALDAANMQMLIAAGYATNCEE